MRPAQHELESFVRLAQVMPARGADNGRALCDGEQRTELVRFRLDVAQMERLLDNLTDNALRYSNPGDAVRLQVRRHGEQVIVSVQDEGEGIPFEQQSRIFEPFVQVGRRKGGVGLGLALAREIAQLHGGQLGVRSRPGEGASFYFSLPV